MKRHNKRPPDKPILPVAWNDWKGLHAYNRRSSAALLLEKGELPLVAIIFVSRDGVRLVSLQSRNARQKALAYRVLMAVGVAFEAEAVCVSCEAWMLKIYKDPGETDDEHRQRSRSGVRPSQSERRIEVLSTTLFYRDSDALYSLGSFDEIIRDDTGKIERLKRMGEDGKDDPVLTKVRPDDGNYANILSPYPPDQSVILEARAFLDSVDADLLEAIGVFL